MLGEGCSSYLDKAVAFPSLLWVNDCLCPVKRVLKGPSVRPMYFFFILGSHNSCLVDGAFVCEASAVERAGTFRAIVWFVIAVDAGIAAYDFVVLALYNCFHVLSAAVT